MSVVSKGLEGIVAAETRLGEVKGAEGVLFYCGYDINELVKVSYEEVVHLLYYNKLPNKTELEKLTTALRAERELPQGVIDFLKTAPKTGPVLALSGDLNVNALEMQQPSAAPLLKLPNVVCTPHLGYVEEATYESYYGTAVEQILAWLAGKPINVANPDVLKT